MRRIAHISNIPLIATMHTKFREDFKSILRSEKLVNSVIKNVVQIFEMADDVWTLNEASIETLREYGYKGNVFIVNNGSDISVTIRDNETKKGIVNKFKLVSEAPIFTYVGQLANQKNVKLIIQALHILHNKGLCFNMLLLGMVLHVRTFKIYA